MGGADMSGRIAFQGEPGAHSHIACRDERPDLEPLPRRTFEDAFAAVREGQAEIGMIPIDNSTAGRVADIHHLLPDSGLHIVGEHFHRVNHHLMALPGVALDELRTVHSHVQALSQCRETIAQLGLERVVAADTAGAAAELAASGDRTRAALASELAAETYGLAILRRDAQDAEVNVTRFVLMARDPVHPDPEAGPTITSFVFRVRSVPAALYKALGGFATNGVNIVKLESYMIDARFTVAQFYADIDGHPDKRPVRLALEELGFFSREVRILGVYPASSYRREIQGSGDD